MTTATRPRFRRLAALALAAALAGAAAPVAAGVTPLYKPAPAYSFDGDVCDLCSINFDLGACERLGGYPYDSTIADPPPAILALSNPQPAQPAPAAPAPAAPAPAAPAAPAPAAPAQQGTSNTNKTGGAANTGTAPTQNEQPAAVTATVPAAPASLAHTVAGRVLTLTWTAPADNGSALTGYKLVLNGGAPITLPADASEYEIELGAGTYEASLIATNGVGDSDASAVVSDIEIVEASASPKPTTDAVAASDSQDAAPSALTGVLTLGALVVVAGALLTWWWLRRRRAASAPTV